jgi:glycine hydroxymethyltransferase
MNRFDELYAADPEIFTLIGEELQRKRTGLELIPSENFTSLAVMQAMGSILTDKYSEGYPGHRYYGGNQVIDRVENLAIERAKQLFGVPYVNVQPYSGSPANLEVYFALLQPGDTVMGLNLADGGHLSHGYSGSVTGQLFHSVPYHTGPDGYIDFDDLKRNIARDPPQLIWVGYTAYPRFFPFEEMAAIADECGAFLVADIAHVAGLVAGGAHPSPVPFAHVVTTTTHKTLRGPRGAMIMVTDKGLAKDPGLAKKMDQVVIPGVQGGPHNHTTAAIAVALLEASRPSFRNYAARVVANAKALAEELRANGVRLVTGGTDTHLLLVDLTPLSEGFGLFAQEALDEAGITVNKNTIPREPFSAIYPSGIRLGTPTVTSRGMKEPQMRIIGQLVARGIEAVKGYAMPSDRHERLGSLRAFRADIASNVTLAQIRMEVERLCADFPIYPELDYPSDAAAEGNH